MFSSDTSSMPSGGSLLSSSVLQLADLFCPPGASSARQIEGEPERWLPAVFPETFDPDSFSDYHLDFWRWVWDVKPGVRPRPLVICWGRGCGKSTCVETAIPSLAALKTRRYGFYVSATQAQADDHLVTIAEQFTAPAFAEAYPDLGKPRVQQVGGSARQLAWRRNRLWTAEGFVVDALGIDTAVRGKKLGRQRPDFIIFDDIDDPADARAKGKKLRSKIAAIAKRILPAGSTDCAVIVAQNAQYRGSIVSKLAGIPGATAPVDFLADRIVIGPIPAIEGLEYTVHNNPRRYQITAGRPTWSRMGWKECEARMMTEGIDSFLVETQHELDIYEGEIYKGVEFRSVTESELPALARIVVWVDPAVTSSVNSDSQGIQCDAMGVDGLVYRLGSWEEITNPLAALIEAIAMAVRHGSETVSIETDQGGDAWRSVYALAQQTYADATGTPLDDLPRFGVAAKAGAARADGGGAKGERQLRMRAAYSAGEIIHVAGKCDALERALRRYPMEPDDLADAAYWAWWDLKSRPAPLMSGTDMQRA